MKHTLVALFFLCALQLSAQTTVTAWTYDGYHTALTDLIQTTETEKVPVLLFFTRKKTVYRYYRIKEKFINMGYGLASGGKVQVPFEGVVLWVWPSRADAEEQLRAWLGMQ